MEISDVVLIFTASACRQFDEGDSSSGRGWCERVAIQRGGDTLGRACEEASLGGIADDLHCCGGLSPGYRVELDGYGQDAGGYLTEGADLGPSDEADGVPSSLV